MGNLGTTEIILIALVFVIFFGAKKIPELAQGLGKGIREFRKAAREVQEDVDTDGKKIDARSSESKG
ncbi:MAG: twin-arginine translocase TatA/TatE family subunit [Ignavibacteriae bacterium]|nr:twin-arginine translocase TatA/TatE family subunit [Ignavibacteriota bacterium]MBK7258207.1 twin-arginine translocase TatA/TatE family subunit [Ignavibacteriota bacterium]